jgi:hypothetical protein
VGQVIVFCGLPSHVGQVIVFCGLPSFCGAGHRFLWPARFGGPGQTTQNDRLPHMS